MANWLLLNAELAINMKEGVFYRLFFHCSTLRCRDEAWLSISVVCRQYTERTRLLTDHSFSRRRAVQLLNEEAQTQLLRAAKEASEWTSFAVFKNCFLRSLFLCLFLNRCLRC